MTDTKTHGVSDVATHFSLMQGEREVKAILLTGDWGPFWALHDSEADLIALRQKKYLPFNGGTGKGYVLKRLGLSERVNTPDQIKQIEERIAADKAGRKDGSHRKHRAIMEDENQPARERVAVRSATGRSRGKRRIRVSDF